MMASSQTPAPSLARRATRRLTRIVKRLLGIAPPPAPPSPRNKHLWSIGLYAGASPLQLGPDPRFANPVMTRDQVTDISCAFVADPFLVRKDGIWHLFFEAFNRRAWRGEIALATSPDLATWSYQRVVLAEPFHLSYPFVFEWEGAHYMIPETHQTRTIRLYKADAFPGGWRLVHTLISGERYADTTLVRHEDRWWLFTETSPGRSHDTLRLFHADDLMGQWTEHPASPIVAGDAHTARPGGSVVRTADGLVRFAQDCAPAYGLRVNAFTISTLSPTSYVEAPAAANARLGPSGSGWNESGMHHVDAHEDAPGQWIAAVDGWYAASSAHVMGTSLH